MKKYDVFLIASFLATWIWSGIHPNHRDDWLAENVLVVLGVIAIGFSFKYFKLSRISYSFITIYLIIHLVGAHYSYSEVPLGDWIKDWVGGERNMYDRLIHFSYGLLLAYPTREIFRKVSSARGFLSYYIPIEMTLAVSALYEIMEWLTAITIHQTAGVAFVGAQGDKWDAQKDMLVAGIGAALAMIILYSYRKIINNRKRVDAKR